MVNFKIRPSGSNWPIKWGVVLTSFLIMSLFVSPDCKAQVYDPASPSGIPSPAHDPVHIDSLSSWFFTNYCIELNFEATVRDIMNLILQDEALALPGSIEAAALTELSSLLDPFGHSSPTKRVC